MPWTVFKPCDFLSELWTWARSVGHREMGIGQPAATKQVAQLEKRLGLRLLHRSTHDVTPTEIGALYY